MSDIENPNFLSQFGYKISIKRIPNIEYFCQSVTLPGISLNYAVQPTPFTQIPLATGVEYRPFSFVFKVDENLVNWRAINSWMLDSGNSKDLNNYKTLKDSFFGLTSDISVSILKSSMIKNKTIVFKDAFPVDLGDVTLTSIGSDINYIESTISFQYTNYEIV